MAFSLRPLTIFPITTRTLEVLRVEDVTPGMRRITLGGPGLKAHVAENGFPVEAFRSDGFDDEFKIFLQHPDAAELVAPTQADGVLNWPRGDSHLLFRTYTARRWDPTTGELAIDFVRHGIGPATTWASQVQPGESVRIAGPKSSAPHPEGADWVLIAGDETALPAIGRWLENWPEGARAQVFIEIGEEDHRQQLVVPEGVELTWLSRDGAAPGTTSLLHDAIIGAEWWSGTAYAWVSGETLSLIPIRRWLRNEKDLPKSQVEVAGYWRKQEVVLTAGEPGGSSVQDLEASGDDEEKFHELSEMLPAFALRVAATVGLAEAFEGGQRSATSLAAATNTDPQALGKLLRYLAALDVVEQVAAATGHAAPEAGSEGIEYRLTDLGRELEDDYVSEGLDLDGFAAAQELAAALSLLAAVRTGVGDSARWLGEPWEALAQQPGRVLDERIEHEAEDAFYATASLADHPLFARLSRIAVIGQGQGVIAASLVAKHSQAHVTILSTPSEIAALQQAHPAHERISYQAAGSLTGPTAETDAVLLNSALGRLPDADATHLLRECAQSLTSTDAQALRVSLTSAGDHASTDSRVGSDPRSNTGAPADSSRVLVFAELLEIELADEHEYEHDLIDFALSGGGARTDAEYRDLFTSAGLAVIEKHTVGWGYTMYELH